MEINETMLIIDKENNTCMSRVTISSPHMTKENQLPRMSEGVLKETKNV